jgi:hypothetical protein
MTMHRVHDQTLLIANVSWPSKVLIYVKFERPQRSESQNIYIYIFIYLLFWLKGILENKHETDVNESIILAMVYKDDYVKQGWRVFA